MLDGFVPIKMLMWTHATQIILYFAAQYSIYDYHGPIGYKISSNFNADWQPGKYYITKM